MKFVCFLSFCRASSCRFLCLEFSHVKQTGLKELYDLYSFNVIPKIGGLVANDAASYQYLVESIRTFPDQVCDTVRPL